MSQDKSKAKPAVVVSVDGVEVASFPFLCSVCREIVARYINNLGRRSEHMTSLRTVKKKAKE